MIVVVVVIAGLTHSKAIIMNPACRPMERNQKGSNWRY